MSYFSHLCVFLLLSDFNMLDCTVFCDMLEALAALCHLFEFLQIIEVTNIIKCKSIDYSVKFGCY